MKQTQAIQLPPGIVKSGTPASVPGRWNDGNLVRWHGGALQPMGGWDRATSSPHTSVCRRLLTILDDDNLRRTVMACEAGLFVETSGTIDDVTPAGFTAADPALSVGGYGTNVFSYDDYGDGRPDTIDPFARPYGYFLDTWGNTVLAVHSSDGRLMQWTPSSPVVDAVVLTTGTPPDGIMSMVVTPERHCVVGGYTGNLRTVRWCSREDLTDWSLVSTTNTAGEIQLETPSNILTMAKVREGTLIFTDTDIWLMRYVGQPFVYGVEKISEHTSPICPQAVATFDGRAAWMGNDGFYSYSGGEVQHLQGAIDDFVFDDFARTTGRFTVAASANGVFPEVWFAYPRLDATDNDIIAVWNYVENWWTKAEIVRTAMYPAGLNPWMTTTGYDKHTYLHEQGWLDAGATRVGDVWAETGAISLGAGDRVMAVMGGQPDSFTGATNTRFRFYTRFSREGDELDFGPYLPEADGFFWTRFAARDVRMRVEANADGLWTVGNMRLQLSERGRR